MLFSDVLPKERHKLIMQNVHVKRVFDPSKMASPELDHDSYKASGCSRVPLHRFSSLQ